MRNCELLASVSVNSGVAANLARDLIQHALDNKEIIKPEQFAKITEIKSRLKQAVLDCEQLERIANDYDANKEN